VLFYESNTSLTTVLESFSYTEAHIALSHAYYYIIYCIITYYTLPTSFEAYCLNEGLWFMYSFTIFNNTFVKYLSLIIQ